MNGAPENQMYEDARSVNPITGIEKRCTKCREVKPLSEFHQRKRAKSGLRSQCKLCRQIESMERFKQNPEYFKQWYVRNKERHNEYSKQQYEKNKEQHKENMKKWRIQNPDWQKKWYAKNPEYQKQWRARNPQKVKVIQDKQHKKNKSIPKARLNKAIRDMMGCSLKGAKANRRWESLVDFTVEQLKRHLEKKFKPGMSWENMGQWHVDHKIPIAAFNFEKPEDIDFKRCWSLKNLQPMWARENQMKGAKLDKPFQPSLCM